VTSEKIARTRNYDSRRGFTLTEVMVAMTILVMGVAGMVSVLRLVVRGTDTNRMATLATFLAQDKQEALMIAGYDAMAAGSDSTNNVTRTWTVTLGAGYKSIAVTTSWTGIDKMSHSYTCTSIASP
jgi:prepilin-type N-terminal cleavage/methylation domain-containing protein